MKFYKTTAILATLCLLQTACQTSSSVGASERGLAKKTIDAIEASQLVDSLGALDSLSGTKPTKASTRKKVNVPAQLQVSKEDAKQIAAMKPKWKVDYIVKTGKKNSHVIVYVRDKDFPSIMPAIFYAEKVDGKWVESSTLH